MVFYAQLMMPIDFSALDQLIRDPGLLQQLSASARQTAKSRFSTQANIQS